MNNKPKILEEEIDNCIICHEIPTEVVCCPSCQNGPFCKSCFSSCLSFKQMCPLCKHEILQAPEVNKVLQKVILRYQAKCGNQGCAHSGSLESVIKHMESCKLQLAKCKYHEKGCSVVDTREELELHENSCDFGDVTCTCGAVVPRNLLQAHVEEVCPNGEVQCECNTVLLRKDTTEHLKTTCPLRLVHCKNSTIGCSFHDTFEMYEEIHKDECAYNEVAQGLTMIVKRLDRLAAENEELKLQNRILMSRLNAVEYTTRKVMVKADFSGAAAYVTSHPFYIEGASCHLKFYPVAPFCSDRSAVYLKVDSFFDESCFLISMIFRINDMGPFVYLFHKRAFGDNFENKLMIDRNSVENIEFTVSAKVLDVLAIGDEDDVNRVYNKLDNQLLVGVPAAIAKNVCTVCITPKTATQQMFECITCGGVATCEVCAKECHAHHNVVDKGKREDRCLCSSNSKCTALHFSKLLK